MLAGPPHRDWIMWGFTHTYNYICMLHTYIHMHTLNIVQYKTVQYINIYIHMQKI